MTKENGFDIAVGVSDRRALDAAHVLGITCIVDLGLTKVISDDNEKWNEYLERVKQAVRSLKAHPAVFAWYIVDEPDWQQIPLEKLFELRKTIRNIDQEKPLFSVLALTGTWEEYLPYFDIIAIDPYLKKKRGGVSEDPSKVTEWIRRLRTALHKRGLRKPVWVVLGAFEERPLIPAYESPFKKPTPEEFKSMVRNALRERVDAILVWTLSFRGFPKVEDWSLPKDDPELWNAVRNLPESVRRKQ